jgi:hypothetical protein
VGSVPVALTAREYIFLLAAVGPLVLAVAVVWIVWRWAKRSEGAEREGEGDG